MSPFRKNPLLAALRGHGWPTVAGPKASQVLAQIAQLEESQWWPAEVLRERQMRQLGAVARHAAATIPFWARRFAEAGFDPAAELAPESLAVLPLLERSDLQGEGRALVSPHLPREHGAVREHRTSGSTGSPVTVWGTATTRLFWRALALREHLWHGRRFSGRLAKIRCASDPQALPPGGKRYSSWGSATRDVADTGPCFLMDVESTTEQQARWLGDVRPNYLATYPSVAGPLAGWFLEHGGAPEHLEQVRTFGEPLDPAVRRAVREVLGVPVVDAYSTQEVGHIAFQCPHGADEASYHVQEESLLVEVLDAEGHACAPGKVGRVVVTTLQNFAWPLFRYDTGDFARQGGACACGRGLGALERVLGRRRNMLVLPDGQETWPALDRPERPRELPLHRPFQVVQRTLREIEVRVVRSGAFSPEEEARVRGYLEAILGTGFAITIRCVEEMPRHPGGKFEHFESELIVA